MQILSLEPTSTSPCHHNNLGRGVKRDYQNPVLPAAAIWGSKLSFPLGLFGLTLPQVIDMQLIKHVKRVMVHGALQTHSGKYLIISLEQAQLEVRIGTPIFEASYKDFWLLLMFCWVKMLWQFLWMHNIILCNPDQVLPKLQQEGDFFIMEYIVLS
jgi:hypothetical protein